MFIIGFGLYIIKCFHDPTYTKKTNIGSLYILGQSPETGHMVSLFIRKLISIILVVNDIIK